MDSWQRFSPCGVRLFYPECGLAGSAGPVAKKAPGMLRCAPHTWATIGVSSVHKYGPPAGNLQLVMLIGAHTWGTVSLFRLRNVGHQPVRLQTKRFLETNFVVA